jgi:hypothetical protein
MKPTWVRISVRALILAAVFAGLIVFGFITAMRLGPRARDFQSRASMWRQAGEGHRGHLALCRNEIAGIVRAAQRLRTEGQNIDNAKELERDNAGQWVWWRANQAHTEEMVAYDAMMERKYELAARYPWMSVAPDPPVPYWSGETGPASDEEIVSIGLDDAERDTR